MAKKTKSSEKETQNINPDIVRLETVLRSLFSTPEGKEAIKLFKKLYSFAPICVPGSPPGANELRQGENNFIKRLILISNQGG